MDEVTEFLMQGVECKSTQQLTSGRVSLVGGVDAGCQRVVMTAKGCTKKGRKAVWVLNRVGKTGKWCDRRGPMGTSPHYRFVCKWPRPVHYKGTPVNAGIWITPAAGGVPPNVSSVPSRYPASQHLPMATVYSIVNLASHTQNESKFVNFGPQISSCQKSAASFVMSARLSPTRRDGSTTRLMLHSDYMRVSCQHSNTGSKCTNLRGIQGPNLPSYRVQTNLQGAKAKACTNRDFVTGVGNPSESGTTWEPLVFHNIPVKPLSCASLQQSSLHCSHRTASNFTICAIRVCDLSRVSSRKPCSTASVIVIQ
ncbi:hypothetical protein Bbelb_104670 [Branchiostoma belcheri]|nr:hypothetical protein Bbelb_104670 [Branchiostoma belcheri]